MSDFVCPYCGGEEEYSGDPIGQDERIDIQCESCEKVFVITADYSVTYTVTKTDCLNDEPHIWKDAHRTPFIICGRVEQICDLGCGREHNRVATEKEIAAELKRHEGWPEMKKIILGVSEFYVEQGKSSEESVPASD